MLVRLLQSRLIIYAITKRIYISCNKVVKEKSRGSEMKYAGLRLFASIRVSFPVVTMPKQKRAVTEICKRVQSHVYTRSTGLLQFLACETQFRASAVGATFIFCRLRFLPAPLRQILFPQIFTEKARDFPVSRRNDPVISPRVTLLCLQREKPDFMNRNTVVNRDYSFASSNVILMFEQCMIFSFAYTCMILILLLSVGKRYKSKSLREVKAKRS